MACIASHCLFPIQYTATTPKLTNLSVTELQKLMTNHDIIEKSPYRSKIKWKTSKEGIFFRSKQRYVLMQLQPRWSMTKEKKQKLNIKGFTKIIVFPICLWISDFMSRLLSSLKIKFRSETTDLRNYVYMQTCQIPSWCFCCSHSKV